MKRLGFKIGLGVVAWSVVLMLITSTISIVEIGKVLTSEAKDKLSYMVESKANYFNKLLSETEISVENLGSLTTAKFSLDEAKNNEAYMKQYENSLDETIKRIGEATKGAMGVYVYFNPDITGGVYGSWYSTTKENGSFEKQELGTIDEFTPDNDEMDFYYEPLNAKRAIWMDPYVDKDLEINMISYVKPVYVNDVLIAVVGMDINFDKFSTELAKMKAYDTGGAFLLNNKFDFLYHKELKQEDNFSKIDNGAYKFITDKMSSSDSDVVDYEYRGVKKVLAFSKLPNGFIIAINVPESEIYYKLKNLNNIMFMMLGAAIVVSIFISIIMGKVISGPIGRLTDLMYKTSQLQISDSTGLENMVKRKDEIGTMAKAADTMRNALKEIVTELILITKDVNKNAKTVQDLTLKLKDEADKNALTSKEISDGMQSASASCEEVNSNIEEINSAINLIANKASEGSNISINISERANKLKENTLILARNANEIYRDVKAEVEDAMAKSSAVSEINSLTEAILQITKQTKLLALNASIEASRAGDAGRGFAVVAEAIKKLAEESSTTAENIQRVAATVNASVNNLLGASEKILNYVDKDVQRDYDNLIKNSEQYYEDSQTFNSLMMELSSTTEELNASIDVIMGAVAEVTVSITSSTSSTQDIADRAENTFENIVIVEETAIDNMRSVTKLNNLVRKFDIKL